MKPTIYDFTVRNIKGKNLDLNFLRGKVALIVNTASKCGFTDQYRELEELHKRYHDEGLVIIGFPCNQFHQQEPGDEKQIENFCQVNYGVTFNMMAKIDVNGPNSEPLYQFLKHAAPGIFGTKSIKWNFTKFLIDRSGEKIIRFAPYVKPSKLECGIQSLLNETEKHG